MRKLAFILIPSFTILVVIYLISHYIFYGTRNHDFDPFLQIQPPDLTVIKPKPDSVYRVLCLGGSTTGNYQLDAKDRYPEILRQKLQSSVGEIIVIEVINAGMDWFTSKHSIINYVMNCRDFQPDLVIIMHAINDICRSFSPPRLAVSGYLDSYSHYYGPAINGARPPTFEKFLIRKLIDIVPGHNYFFLKKVDCQESDFVSIDSFESNMDSLVKYVSYDTQDILIVEQPSIYKNEMSFDEIKTLWLSRNLCQDGTSYPSESSMALAMREFNKISLSVAKKHSIPFVHTDEFIPKNLTMFTDDVHYTPAGAAAIAEIVASAVQSQYLTQPSEAEASDQ